MDTLSRFSRLLSVGAIGGLLVAASLLIVLGLFGLVLS